MINERIDAIGSIEKNPNGLEYYDFIRWCSKTWQSVDEIYGSLDPHSEELRNLKLQNSSFSPPMEALILAEEYHSRLQDYIDEIRDSMKTV